MGLPTDVTVVGEAALEAASHKAEAELDRVRGVLERAEARGSELEAELESERGRVKELAEKMEADAATASELQRQEAEATAALHKAHAEHNEGAAAEAERKLAQALQAERAGNLSSTATREVLEAAIGAARAERSEE